MENEIRNDNRAYLSMLKALEDMNEDDENIADFAQKMEDCKLKKVDDFKKARQYAANYFTKEKISELHKLGVEVLKYSVFNEDVYIEKFSDSTKIELNDINLLVEIQNNINEVQERLNSNEVVPSDGQVQIKGASKMMSLVADIFSRKGGANNG